MKLPPRVKHDLPRIEFVPRQQSTTEPQNKHINEQPRQAGVGSRNTGFLSNFTASQVLLHVTESNCVSTSKTNESPKSRETTHWKGKVSPISSKDTNEQKTTNESSTIPGQSTASTATSRKVVIVLIIIAAVILCAAAILIPLFLLVLKPSNSSVNASTTTTTTAVPILAYWGFDNIADDLYNVYNGVLLNNATFLTSANNTPYVGYGFALSLTSALNQSVLIPTPYFNISYTSFTIEAWIYLTNATNDRGIFGQCQCSSCANLCFMFLIRTSRLYAGFNFNDVSGATTLALNTWYHIAFVYNYNTRQQIVYLNGVQDGIVSNSAPYQATNGSIQIGAIQTVFTTSFFNGYIDNVKLITRAKSASEILSDATVIAYYSFDLSNLAIDNGPNGINGTLTNVAFVSGVANQGLRLLGTGSYFQAYGFYQMAYSMNSKPFSVSLWLNPSSLLNGPVIQISRQQTSSTCLSLLSIYSSNSGATGQLQSQGIAGCCTTYNIFGPFIYANTWSHVSLTYSSTNGIIMYVNGTYIGTTTGFTFAALSVITWVQIGNTFPCACCPTIFPFQGAIDELYFHSRELTASEVVALATR